MSTVFESATTKSLNAVVSSEDEVNASQTVWVIRRNGIRTPFDGGKIGLAMTKAFLAVEGPQGESSRRIHEKVEDLGREVVQAVCRRVSVGDSVHIEDIQDQVELALMRSGEHKVARAYVLYRERRAQARTAELSTTESSGLHVVSREGHRVPLDRDRLLSRVRQACAQLPDTDPEQLVQLALHHIYDGISEDELHQALILNARSLIETEPTYSYACARLLLHSMRSEALDFVMTEIDWPGEIDSIDDLYVVYFESYVHRGVDLERLDPRLLEFDLGRLARAIKPERDLQFNYLGLQTLYDRYLIHHEGTRFELPQACLMRVAMGLALHEIEREERAIEFYRLLSAFDFISSTPTLFNSGTMRAQLSSCYLTTVADDLNSIYGAIKDNALLSKFAGGLGNDWSRVRAMGAYIKGTNGKSQGVVPFLKVVNDTAVAVNQGGKRKGAVCAYLETWHLDIEEFLELRKNTGDERRRTHDMNTANWVPDLFMERVMENGSWTLFSPDEVPELHELSGDAFREAYLKREAMAIDGELGQYKIISAVQLWRKMLTQLFETGHPWITFKDACNVRSPQQHVGVIHSSNLCTEITLNTSDQEVAVCNLGSINLAAHIDKGVLDESRLRATIQTAMRMLDNVIDINFYSIPQARRANMRHRPVGLGIMGFQDALYQLGLPYDSHEAIEFADRSMELISYLTIEASSNLAVERGCYPSFEGSLWSRGILPLDTLEWLEQQRAPGHLEADRSSALPWDDLRTKVKRQGMRNSNCMAIAPTATISNIAGVSQSIEPTYQNLFVKSNLSGEFTTVNPYLVQALKQAGLWDNVMVHDLKYYDGSIQQIDRVPADMKRLYKCAFEIDPAWLVEAAARRQKWLDQAQSLNLYMVEPSGSRLDTLYRLAWQRGLKTTYYLRTLGATAAERSTIQDGRLNAVQNEPASSDSGSSVCNIDDGECEACQ